MRTARHGAITGVIVGLVGATLVAGAAGVPATAAENGRDAADQGRVTVQAASVRWRDGLPAGHTYAGEMSDDGQTVLLFTDQRTLVPDPPEVGFHIYVRDMAAGTTRIVTADSDGTPAPGHSWRGMGLSGDGRFAGFSWNAPELSPTGKNPEQYVYVKNLATGHLDATRAVGSGPTAGYPVQGLNVLAVSRHGRYVAGSVAFDTGDPFGGVVTYLLDRRTDRFHWIAPTDGNSRVKALSGNGRYVFYSYAPGGGFPYYYRYDRVTGQSTPVPRGPITDTSVVGNAAFSGNGRLMVISYLDNYVGGTNVLVYRASDLAIVEEVSPGESVDVGGVSRTGRYLAVTIKPDDQPYPQSYRLDRRTGKYTLMAVNAAGEVANRNSGSFGISSDGDTVLIQSRASNLVPGDNPGGDHYDMFVATLH